MSFVSARTNTPKEGGIYLVRFRNKEEGPEIVMGADTWENGKWVLHDALEFDPRPIPPRKTRFTKRRQANFNRLCGRYGLTPEDWGKEVVTRPWQGRIGDKGRICGIVPGNPCGYNVLVDIPYRGGLHVQVKEVLKQLRGAK